MVRRTWVSLTMLVHGRHMSLTLCVVEIQWRDEFPEVFRIGRKAFTPLEVTKILSTENVIESFVIGQHHTMQIVCTDSHPPCRIEDVTNENVVMSLMHRRDGKAGEVEVSVFPFLQFSLLVVPRVIVSLGALQESGFALTLQQTDSA